MKKTLLLFAMAGITIQAFAQPSFNNAAASENLFPYTPTPQTLAFMRYGMSPVDKYTGCASLDIPLYTYKDNDFELPISATYTSQGFIPERQTGILGLNWFLNCGGSISREIKGLPDDYTGNSINGYLSIDENYSEESLLNLEIGEVDSEESGIYNIYGCETTSDIYYFNFLGHTGTFHFNNQGRAQVYNTGGNSGTYTITFDREFGNEIPCFTITAGDGYEYTFGSNESSIQMNTVERSIAGSFSAPSVFRFKNQILAENPIVTWNITKIKAPNGRTVTFEYEAVNSNIGSQIDTGDANNPFLVTTFSTAHNSLDDNGAAHYRNASIVQTTYLSKIIIDNGTEIMLSMSLKGCLDRPATPNSISTIEQDHCITQELMKLDSLTVKSPNGCLTHKSSFAYKVKDNRLVLTGIHTSGIGWYRMQYHEEHPYPPISTADTDFWGFYNGRGNAYNEIYGSEVNLNYDDVISNNTAKLPNWHYSRIGCLKHITYPTKGFSEYKYEANRAEWILLKKQQSNSGMLPSPDESAVPQTANEEELVKYLVNIYPYSTLFGEDNETGGVRIKSITDYDMENGYQPRTFTYSNGIVHTFPKWYTSVLYGYQVYNPFLTYPANSFDRQHIGYAKATEHFANGAYTVSHYNNYMTHPDEYEGQIRQKQAAFNSAEYIYSAPFINNILREPNSNHLKRGRINKIEHYSSGSKLVESSTFKYAASDTLYNTYVILSGKYACSVKRYTGDYRLVCIENTKYFPNGQTGTKQQFFYDTLGRKELTITTHPDSSRIYSKFEFVNDSAHRYCKLPASITLSQGNSENDALLLNVTKYSYAVFGNALLPASIKRAQLDCSTPHSTPIESLTYTIEQRVASYDTMGNPTEIVDKEGIHTAILWGYSGMYPIAQVRNMTSGTLKTTIGISDNTPLSGPLNATQRAKLYASKTALSEVLEYSPLVGITRHYDNQGNCTAYEYDKYGRLSSISDSRGTIELYKYPEE